MTRVTIEPSDVGRLEAAADALARAGELEHAVNVWALVLRFRAELGPIESNVIPLERGRKP